MAERTAWDTVAEEYYRRHGEEGSMSHREYVLPAMLDVLGNIGGKSILDVGCGPGYLTRPLAELGAKVTGADLSGELLLKARELEGRRPLGIRYLQLDAARLEGLKDSSFDIVTSNLAIHAVKGAKPAIMECGRVLKPGGRFVFSIMHPVTDTIELSDYKHDSRGPYVRLRVYGEEREKAHRGFRMAGVPNYHRPFGFYMNALFDAGFSVTGCREISIRHVNTVVGAPGFMLPAIRAGSAFAPGMFSKYVRSVKTEDPKRLAVLAQFPLFLILEGTKTK